MNEQKGFTLVEILVSLAIIGLLASVVLPQVRLAREKAQVAKAQAQLNQVRIALDELSGDTSEWPNHWGWLAVDTGAGGNETWDLASAAAGLTQTDGLFPNWRGPYITTIPVDPWGNSYFFDPDYDVSSITGSTSPAWAPVIGSFGPNGTGQNVFDSDDVIEILESN